MKQKGFTLIELLVVIAVIGLLASVVLVALNSSRVKARDAKRVADLNQIAKAAEFFYDSQGFYPYATAGEPTWDGHWDDFGICLITGATAPCGIATVNYRPVISRVPNDPLDGPGLSDADPTYTGWENRAPNNLLLRALLEDSSNPALKSDADGGWRSSVDGLCDDPWYCIKINWPY
jgi:prepilin-type N-terminal cleavage/methylation domain-containing protein